MAAEARERAERETHNAAEVAGIAAGEAPIAAEERPLNWKHNCGPSSPRTFNSVATPSIREFYLIRLSLL